ncbi:unnamed protein product [Diatraea saccharalis]|uniref:Uncharacterized protein n=1 Tax=Diatraea saccharalis TaxID=40085 RepID=A0A9N9RE29_9NEOP|nr:unnamed protein product [Diatraea saccharalis]
MAVTRRGYIFCAFLLSVLSVLLTVIAISSDHWIVSTATLDNQVADSTIQYGLFRGELVLNTLQTPSFSVLYMTCVPDVSACAVSCKTEPEAREIEVRALAQGHRPSTPCASVTEVDTTNPLARPPVISFAVYVCTLLFIFVMLVFNVISAGLAIINATMNPTEPILGLPGCLWSNIVASCLGVVVMMIFGIYWTTSGLKDHLAFSYISVGPFDPTPALGYSYWLLIGAILCSVTNVVLIQVRAYLLERSPPPPTIQVENHSDGTMFLY